MIGRTLVLLAAILATGVPARAADNPLVGTWRIASFEREIVETKAVSQGFGGNAMGLMTLTPDGRAWVCQAQATRPADPDRR
jgi:hypothetical protein